MCVRPDGWERMTGAIYFLWFEVGVTFSGAQGLNSDSEIL